MAGNDMEQATRRLRGREVPVAVRSVVAVTQNENFRKTKTATKRAAMDDNTNRTATNVPAPQAKKRAALANLTNHSNVAAPRFPSQTSKSQSASLATVAANKVRLSATQVKEPQTSQEHQSKDVLVSQEKEIEVLQLKSGRASLTSSSVTVDNNENAQPEQLISSVERKPLSSCGETSFTDVKTVASLERKTQHSLYISRENKPRVRQGALFDQNADKEGWSSKNYMDIDSHKDPQMCSAYAADIYDHLRVAELKRRPLVDFMETVQQDINASMRGILVDWLVEVAEEYKLVPDTLYLTVSYIDRFLSENLVSRQRLQLLGVACMLIASKYEEICAPQVEEFCYITDNTYNREEVLEMERRVLNYLHFELTGPTTKSFLRRFIRAAQAGQKFPLLQLEFLGNYLSELTLLEYDFLRYLPSMVAASSVFLAKLTLDATCKPWNSTLQHYSGYKASELKDCVKAIHDLQKNTKNCTLPAIREKYRQHKFKCVASLPSPATIPSEYFEDVE